MTDTNGRLILASGSSYKRELLERLGLEFESIPANVDESRHEGEPPRAMAERLATAKAVRIRESHPDAWVIGADQVIHRGDTIFEKPGSPDLAVAQLSRLSGGAHILLTAVSVAAPRGSVETALVEFEMQMRSLTIGEIQTYVDEDSPVDCAGSYKIEAGGIRLFRRMDGDDYTAIVGLPLTRVWALLEDTGFIAHSNGST